MYSFLFYSMLYALPSCITFFQFSIVPIQGIRLTGLSVPSFLKIQQTLASFYLYRNIPSTRHSFIKSCTIKLPKFLWGSHWNTAIPFFKSSIDFLTSPITKDVSIVFIYLSSHLSYLIILQWVFLLNIYLKVFYNEIQIRINSGRDNLICPRFPFIDFHPFAALILSFLFSTWRSAKIRYKNLFYIYKWHSFGEIYSQISNFKKKLCLLG